MYEINTTKSNKLSRSGHCLIKRERKLRDVHKFFFPHHFQSNSLWLVGPIKIVTLLSEAEHEIPYIFVAKQIVINASKRNIKKSFQDKGYLMPLSKAFDCLKVLWWCDRSWKFFYFIRRPFVSISCVNFKIMWSKTFYWIKASLVCRVCCKYKNLYDKDD